MAKLKKRELILIKIETTQGTDAVPTAALDAMLVFEQSWSFNSARMIERNAVKGTLGKLQSVFAGTLIDVTFKAEIKGSGALGVIPEAAAALRGCGLGETIVAATSVAYSPVSTGHESVTLYYHEDNSFYKILGAFGTANLVMNTGELAMYEFTFTGHVVGPADIALPDATVDAIKGLAVINGAFTSLGFAATIQGVNLDLGNEISTPDDFNAADGFSDVLIIDNDPNGSFNPQAETVATKDFHGEWKANTAGAINTGDIGSVAGEKFSLSMPTAYYRELGPGDRDGLTTIEIGYAAAGDDAAFTLLFN